MNISIKLVYQYMTIFFNFLPISNHLHPLQVGNCGIVDEDYNVKSGLKGLTCLKGGTLCSKKKEKN